MSTQTIVLGEVPKSTQHIYRAACQGGFPKVYMTSEGKRLKRDYQLEARMQYGGFMLREPLALTIRFYFPNKRKRDTDNFNKLILDALTGVVYQDDSLVEALHLYRFVDKKRPRVEITVH